MLLFGGDTSWDLVSVTCPYRVDPPDLPWPQKVVPYVFSVACLVWNVGQVLPPNSSIFYWCFLEWMQMFKWESRTRGRGNSPSSSFFGGFSCVSSFSSNSQIQHRWSLGSFICGLLHLRSAIKKMLSVETPATSVFATTRGRKSRICEFLALKTIIGALETS